MRKKAPFSLSRKTLAWLCASMLLLSLLPLYIIAFYNHPFYDDFGFTLLTHEAWQKTGSLGAVLSAAWQNTVGIRQTWEGTYATSLISAMQPGIFGEGLYWIATVVLLTGLLLCLWFFLRQALWLSLPADKPSFVIVFSLAAFCMVQFVPDAAESFFWFNGGVAYTLLWSLTLLTAGLWLKLNQARGKAQTIGLFACALAMTAFVGGSKYSTALPACLLAVLFTLWAFLGKRSKKWLYLILTLVLVACVFFSAAAPGNQVRAKTLHGGMSAPMAIAQSLFFGFALMGSWFSLPLVALSLMACALLIPSLKKSAFTFTHPLWVSVLSMGLFCSQLTPTLYTGNFLGDGRVINTYYFTCVLLLLGLVLYWAGWAVRKLEAKGYASFPKLGAPLPGRLLAVALALLAAGCLACQPESLLSYDPKTMTEGASRYGPHYMAGGSAALSLFRGEAQAYDQAMDARDALLNDPTLDEVTLAPITTVPRVFMSDALDGDSLEYELSLYAEYYGKAKVSVVSQGE